MSRGRLRALHIDPGHFLQIVPVDIVANTTIASAWDLINNPGLGTRSPRVYNLSASTVNPCSLTVLGTSSTIYVTIPSEELYLGGSFVSPFHIEFSVK